MLAVDYRDYSSLKEHKTRFNYFNLFNRFISHFRNTDANIFLFENSAIGPLSLLFLLCMRDYPTPKFSTIIT